MPPVYLQMILILILILCSASNLTKALAKQEAEHRIKKSQDLPRMIYGSRFKTLFFFII